MAATLPTLCLFEVLECLCDDRLSLYHCVLVNRHWSQHAISFLWRDPLTNIKGTQRAKLSLTLLKTLTEDEQQALSCVDCYHHGKNLIYPYTTFIRNFDLPSLAQVAKETIFTREVETEKYLTTLCCKILNQDAVIFNVNFDIVAATNKARTKKLFSKKDWHAFNFWNSPSPFNKLRSLIICEVSARKILPRAAHICPNLLELELLFYRRAIHTRNNICPPFDWFSLIESFTHLEKLSFTPAHDISIYSGDHLPKWALHLPPKLHTFCFDLNLDFTEENLEDFLKNLTAPVKKLTLRKSSCISNAHLEVITKFANAELEVLDISAAVGITRTTLRNARAKISVVRVSHIADLYESDEIEWWLKEDSSDEPDNDMFFF